MAVNLKVKKASPGQSYLKICAYGPTGSGKSILMLEFLEWICKKEKKRAFVFDTEHSNDFYSAAVKERVFHPEAFDFDVPETPTRQLIELRDFLHDLTADDPYCAVGTDSLSHFWDSAFDLYTGRKTSIGTIPIQGWQKIKRPWRQMMEYGIFGNFHWFFTAREGNVFERDDAGEFESKGTRPRAEKEAGYEPNMTIRMYQDRDDKREEFTIKSYVEKDRSGIWTGKTIIWPKKREALEAKVDEVFGSVYHLLVPSAQASSPKTFEDAAADSVDKLVAEEAEKELEANLIMEDIRNSMVASHTMTELKVAWEKTKGKKLKLGDERYEELEKIKESQKIRVQTAAAAVAV